MLSRILTLVLKELEALLLDPQGRRLLLVPLFLQIAIFPLAATLEVKNSTLGILNRDAGSISSEIIERFSHAKAFTHLLYLRDEGQMRQAVEQEKALAVLYFPVDFSRRVAAGQSPNLQVILDGRRSNSAQISFSYIQDILTDYGNEQAWASGRPVVSEVIVRHWFNPNLDYTYFVLPSLVAIITTISLMVVTALSVAREREQGTFDQLLVSPLTPEMIMLGKLIPAILVAMLQATVILTASIFIYGISFQGSLLLLYGSMLFYGLAVGGFGLLISSVCATQQQAYLGIFAFTMPAVLLSGFAAPVENQPVWLQYLTWFDPLRHFILIVKSIYLKDASAVFVAENVWPLLVISILTLSAAIGLFRRRYV